MHSPDLNFLHGLHTPRCIARVDKYFRGYATLQYMVQGGVELHYDQKAHALQGCWFWPAWDGPHIRFHPGAGHTWWEHRYVAIQGPLLSRWFAAELYPTTPQVAPRGREHARAFDDMIALFNQPGRWPLIRAVNLLEGLLFELAQARSQSLEDQQLVDRVDQLMNESGYALDYQQIAASLKMGLSTLRRRFAQATGESLHAYVLNAKLNAARHWLRETDTPIKTIAAKLGYRDVYFFSRQFREKTGIPPRLYRISRQD